MEFYRKLNGKVFGGICNGIGDKYYWDVTHVRIVSILLLIFFNFFILIIYFILWLVLPAIDDEDSNMVDEIKSMFDGNKN